MTQLLELEFHPHRVRSGIASVVESVFGNMIKLLMHTLLEVAKDM